MTESYKFYEPVSIEPFILQLWRRQVVRSSQASPLTSPKPPQHPSASSFSHSNPNYNYNSNSTATTTSAESSASGSLRASHDGSNSDSSSPPIARVQEPYQMAGYLGAQTGIKVPKFTFRKSDRLSTSREKLTVSSGPERSDSSGSTSHEETRQPSLFHSSDAAVPFARPPTKQTNYGRESPVLVDTDDDFGYKSPFGAPSRKGAIAFDDDDGYRSPFGPPPPRKPENSIAPTPSYPITSSSHNRSVPALNITPSWGDYPQPSYSAASSGRSSLTNSARSSPPRSEQDAYQVNFYRNGELVAEPKHDPELAQFTWVGTGRWADRSFTRVEICDMFRDLCIALKQEIDCPIIMPETFAPATSGSSLARGAGYGDLLGRRDRPHPYDDEREAILSDSPQVPNSVSDYPDLLL